MLRHARQVGQPLDWTFYCVLGRQGHLDEEAKALGAQIIYSPVPIGRKRAFIGALRNTLRRGRYDVMHCHHDLVSGLYLLASAGLPIGLRLAHAHNADEVVPVAGNIKQRLLREPLRRIGLVMADRVIGISNHTLDTYLGGRSRRPGRDFVHYYGTDPTPFEKIGSDSARFRSALDLPADAVILLFGGRLVPEKNPVFAVDVLSELRRLQPRAVLLFAGAGSEEAAILARADRLGVVPYIRMLGWRNDLAAVMAHSDCFILPRPEHPMEGFGLAVLEAQLAGMRLLLSQGVPDDPLLPTACYRRLPLASGPAAWAKAANELLSESSPSRDAVFAAFAKSPFALDTALPHLMALHRP